METNYATPALERLMRAFFEAKSGQEVEATMGHFSRSDLVYTDATLGWVMDYDEILGIYSQYMPQWGEGRTYPTRLAGDEHSALVFMTCTPELFGQEVIAIVAADMRDGEIVRWVDYWDGRHFGVEAVRANEATRPREEGESFPASFGEEQIERVASGPIVEVAEALSRAMAAGEAEAAAALFSADCVVEDMTLRSQLRGRLALERYFERALPALPYGSGSELRHVLGSGSGGGFEWKRGPEECGVTALELDDDGAILRMTSVWNGARMTDEDFVSLVAQGAEPFALASS